MQPATIAVMSSSPIDLGRRLLAIAQTGLHFTEGEYDRERYHEVAQIAAELIAQSTSGDAQKILDTWFVEEGYATPKIDVRGAMFRDDRVLLVRERSDGKWTLPGGWADVNDTPTQAVEKEIVQESGFTAKAVKIAAIRDRRWQGIRNELVHAWKVFFLCEITGGEARISNETDAVEFFALDELPPLSVGRSNAEQIRRMYEHHRNPALHADFD
jgi:ADP-ribose pyrophosphatase YjhB (NUDIX family)